MRGIKRKVAILCEGDVSLDYLYQYVCVCVLFHLELCRNDQFRGLQPHEHVQTHEGHDGHEDGEVADELPHLKINK